MGYCTSCSSLLGIIINCSDLKPENYIEVKNEYPNDTCCYDDCDQYIFIDDLLNDTNKKFDTILSIIDITNYDYDAYTENLHPFKHTIAIVSPEKKASAEFWGYSRCATNSGFNNNFEWSESEKNAGKTMLELLNLPVSKLSLITQVNGG